MNILFKILFINCALYDPLMSLNKYLLISDIIQMPKQRLSYFCETFSRNLSICYCWSITRIFQSFQCKYALNFVLSLIKLYLLYHYQHAICIDGIIAAVTSVSHKYPNTPVKSVICFCYWLTYERTCVYQGGKKCQFFRKFFLRPK